MLIVILGPDGSGKTTISTIVKNESARIGFNYCIFLETNFSILPTISTIKNFLLSPFNISLENKYAHSPGEYMAGMKGPINSFLKSVILLVWYSIDYFLGRKIVSNANRDHGLVIFARYYYDFYYQRVHRKLPAQLVKFFEYFIPEPDVIIFLSRDRLSIYDDKPELSVDEIQVQNEIILSEFSEKDNFYVVDARDGVDSTVSAAIDIIKLARR